MLYLSGYEYTKQAFSRFILPEKMSPGAREVSANLAGGIAASISSQIVVVPVDIISQKQMLHTSAAAEIPSVPRIGWEILKNSGPLGFYRGFLTSVATYAPSSGIWWTTYAGVKRCLREFVYNPGDSYYGNLGISAGKFSLVMKKVVER